MKEILKVMRFDYLTARPLALPLMIFAVILFSVLGLLLSPMIPTYICFLSILFVIPLQLTADKCGFNKLYGILPVKRKSIARARFLYIWLVFFITVTVQTLIAVISGELKLVRFLPNQNSEMVVLAVSSFEKTDTALRVIFVTTAFFCLLFAYFEMMAQIFGLENEFKVIMITVAVLTIIAFGFTFLYSKKLLPIIKLPELPSTVPGMLALGAVCFAVLLGICILFGEITAAKFSKREL